MTARKQPTPPTSPGVRRRLDDWWPTLLRYTGLLIALYEIFPQGLEHPAVLVLAGGMMGLKDVLAR
jgi:hypothetical protein